MAHFERIGAVPVKGGKRVLAIDIGGTKMLGALVEGNQVSEVVRISTPGAGDPSDWIDALLATAPEWQGRYDRVAVPTSPDYELVAMMRQLDAFVIAEGRVRTPEQAAEALNVGANAVVVGSAITRTEHIVSWYCDAMGLPHGTF